MKPKTYQVLRRSYFQYKDPQKLNWAKGEENNPFDQFVIDVHLNPSSITWDSSPFTQQFRKGSPRERLDDTVITFLLHVIAVVYREKFTRSFLKPESAPVWLSWVTVLKYTIVCVLGLMYNIEWHFENLKEVDLFIAEILNSGKPETLRKLMNDLGISLREEPFPAEKKSGQLMLLHTHQFGSFYWRLLHWMAEAYELRKEYSVAVKKAWRDLVTYNFYRLLACQICQFHFRQIVNELKEEMLSETTNYSSLWFKIHNKVNANRRTMYPTLTLPDYSESEYSEDSKVMVQGLSQV